MAENILQEQVCIITGASHGIGEAVARCLAAMGGRVVLAARNRARLEEMAHEWSAEGLDVTARPTDMRRPEEVEGLIAGTVAAHGRVDVLVNNAGIGAFGTPLHELAPEDWQAVMETNLRGPYLALRAVAPHMIRRQSGHIINISSLAAHNPVPKGAAYAASKWGLKGMTISAAEELRAYGIRVSLVCPGSVDTDLVPDRGRNRAVMLQPDDVAHVVAMLVTQNPQSFVSEVLMRPTRKP